MQGYILHVNACSNEDLIVTILTNSSIQVAYRFYGARHSTINLGYKIDAELIYGTNSSLPQLRHVIHLSNTWEFSIEHLLLWQKFIDLFYQHLKQVEVVDEFYFSLLDSVAHKFTKQNPKRLQVEAYAKLLSYEGRLHRENTCFLCDQKITQDITLSRAYLPAHSTCIGLKGQDIVKINTFLNTKSTLALDDNLVNYLWNIMHEGF